MKTLGLIIGIAIIIMIVAKSFQKETKNNNPGGTYEPPKDSDKPVDTDQPE